MLGVIFALREEALRLGPGATVAISGSGCGHAARAAENLVAAHRLSGLISAGFAGALSPELRVGNVVVETRVPEWQALARRMGGIEGRILTMDRIVRTAAERVDLAARTGALAVDMESAAIAEVASRHHLPFANIRAITDTAARDLVLDWDNCRGSDGHFHLLTLLSRALRTPRGMAEIPQLWYASRLASRSLGRVLRELTGGNGSIFARERTGS